MEELPAEAQPEDGQPAEASKSIRSADVTCEPRAREDVSQRVEVY